MTTQNKPRDNSVDVTQIGCAPGHEMSSSAPVDLPQNASFEVTEGGRITLTSRVPYSTVLTRFRTTVPQMPAILDRTSQKAFTQQVAAAVGSYGFARFHEYNHGAWIGLFPNTESTSNDKQDKGPNGGRGLHRYVFGNPLIAITMIQEDVEAGLHVPIDALFIEMEDGNAKCVLQLPSGLIAGHEKGRQNAKLVLAARKLDEKVLIMMRDLMA
jgi:hypothetical protein